MNLISELPITPPPTTIWLPLLQVTPSEEVYRFLQDVAANVLDTVLYVMVGEQKPDDVTESRVLRPNTEVPSVV
jgi:hypothetical protein